MAFWNDVEICFAAEASVDDPGRLAFFLYGVCFR